MTTPHIIVDARERDWIQMLFPAPSPCSLLRPQQAATCAATVSKIHFSHALLPCGDAHLYLGERLVCVVERKTLSDLLRSQEDTRLAEQLGRLDRCATDVDVVLLVEGRMDLTDAATRQRVWKILESVRHAHPRVDVRTTTDLAQTVEWVGVRLERQARWATETPTDHANGVSDQTVVQIALAPRKASVTPAALVAHLLSCVPGVSHATAEAMRAAFDWATVAACLRDLSRPETQARVAAWRPPSGAGRRSTRRLADRRLSVLLALLGVVEEVQCD